MHVRDAVEDDAEALAGLADAPAEAMRATVHDRTVRVAETDAEIVGFVGFDARRDAVILTHLAGSATARERLVDEPVRFARSERMPVESIVPESEAGTTETLEAAGFEREGTGPRFDGEPTVRYRLDP